jgi:hypothetical protein
VRFYKLPGGYRLGTIKNLAPIQGNLLEALLAGRSWRLMTALLTRRLSNRVGPSDPEMIRCEDADYVLRCTVAAKESAHCPRGLLYYRALDNTMSTKRSALAHRSMVKERLATEQYALELLPPERAKPKLARACASWAVMFYQEGAPEHGKFWAERVRVHDPTYSPEGIGTLAALAYRLGGFRLWGLETKLSKAAWSLAGRAWGKVRKPQTVASLPLATDALLRFVSQR